MSQQELDHLDEVKATGDESEVMDPVAPAGGSAQAKRKDKKQGDAKADKIDGVTPEGKADAKAPANKADKGMKEDIDAMFASDELSEEFKEKATVVFEAAVNAKLSEEVAALEEQFNTKLDEQVEVAVSELTEKVDSYLDYVVERWMQENEVALEKGIRSEIAESFLKGMHDLFVEHNVHIEDSDVDVIVGMTEQLQETEDKLNESVNEVVELRKELEESKRNDVFVTVSEGLAETQVEKLSALVEGLDFADLQDYQRKVEIIKENYFGAKQQTLAESAEDIDPIDEAEPAKALDEAVAGYASAISRTIRK